MHEGDARPTPPSPAGVLLVLNAMSEADREALAAHLEGTATSIAIGKNPFVEDLAGSGDSRAALGALFREIAPGLTAGAGLASGAWASSDGTLEVRAVARCGQGAARCLDPFAPSDADAVGDRARFLAWSLSSSVLLAATPPSSAREVAGALRAAARAPDSRIALALEGVDLHALRESPALAAVRAGARHVLDEAGDAELRERAILEALASSDAGRDPMPWMSLPEGAVLVVPRLGAVATHGAFVDEVRARAGARAVVRSGAR